MNKQKKCDAITWKLENGYQNRKEETGTLLGKTPIKIAIYLDTEETWMERHWTEEIVLEQSNEYQKKVTNKENQLNTNNLSIEHLK